MQAVSILKYVLRGVISMWWLVVIAFVLLMFFSLDFRLIVFNFGKVLYYAPIDL